jgi:toxin YoeB
MNYSLDIPTQVEEEIQSFKKSNPVAYKKVNKLLKELIKHPYTGTGKPEKLKYRPEWSRRITGLHRLLYTINDETVIVKVISASSHYDNK